MSQFQSGGEDLEVFDAYSEETLKVFQPINNDTKTVSSCLHYCETGAAGRKKNEVQANVFVLKSCSALLVPEAILGITGKRDQAHLKLPRSLAL
ncbi:hypothetical protein Y1Q_0020445 [Alligator mississippiensis]|uniref:Uncharacterized protein n=1 Tax=Alligator mississippiensis TaxID=8496 RepID=A0A151N6Z4_ALLMI|nr:hypothetical protein Y1Q_0020445 [Alligator mississippiensis]